MKIIPYGKQHIDSSDIAEVVKVLKSDWITQGPKVKEFEEALCKYTGAKYAVCVSSGTAALHLSCLAAGLKKGDEAITTPITFIATSNSILYTGASPVFADIDYDSVNINPEEISKKISKKTKAILPVHFAGLPCDIPEIAKIAKKNKLSIIEDAAHALGAEYKHGNRWYKVGCCKHSDMTTFSFHPVKHITTGEGGAITTNNKKIYEKLLMLRSHGTLKNDSIKKKHGPWYYEMRELGYNYRITDFQCALGLSQLKKIDKFILRRKEIVKMYNHAFKWNPCFVLLQEKKYVRSSWHLYPIRLEAKSKIGAKRKSVFNYLRKRNIDTQVHYIPVYWQPYYQQLGYKKGLCPKAEADYEQIISLPIFPNMTDKNVDYVIENILSLIK